jgi:hypothetical protein
MRMPGYIPHRGRLFTYTRLGWRHRSHSKTFTPFGERYHLVSVAQGGGIRARKCYRPRKVKFHGYFDSENQRGRLN